NILATFCAKILQLFVICTRGKKNPKFDTYIYVNVVKKIRNLKILILFVDEDDLKITGPLFKSPLSMI
ncbi:hypothetical protein ACJX0J_006925, partial [Zea mays]